MPHSLKTVIADFNDAFSNQRLDDVMSFFAEDAEFRELNGHVAQNKDEIRQAVAKIFSGAYGKMTFIERNLIIDEERKEACFSWYCQHDMQPASNMTLGSKMTAGLLKLLYGSVFHWEGMDYFVFDNDLKIVSKQSYGKASMIAFVKGAAKQSR